MDSYLPVWFVFLMVIGYVYDLFLFIIILFFRTYWVILSLP